MKKIANPIFFHALIFSVSLILFSTTAQAYVYDDFTNAGINPNLWVDRGPHYWLFYQPGDGYLYFSDSIGGQDDRLTSFHQVSGAFSVLMQYSNFQASNNQPSGQGKASILALALADGSNWVSIVEGKNISGLFFQASYYHNGTMTNLKTIYPGNVTSGWLQIKYNGTLDSGGKVDFLYNFGAGWVVLDSCAPNFSKAPWFSIRGNDTYGQSLSFQIDQVQVITPNLAPTSLLLLQ